MQFAAQKPQSECHQEKWGYGRYQNHEVRVGILPGVRHCISKPDDDDHAKCGDDTGQTDNRDSRDPISARTQCNDYAPSQPPADQKSRQQNRKSYYR